MERLTFDGNFCDIAKCGEINDGSSCKDGYCSQRKVWERLKQYEDAEAEGRLVVLPCKVGDTVYMPYKGRAHKLRVQGISVSISGNDVVLHFGGYPVANVWGSEVGRTVFLTKEEAEQALKGAVDVF